MLTGMGASMHVTTARELIVTLRHLHDHPESLKAPVSYTHLPLLGAREPCRARRRARGERERADRKARQREHAVRRERPAERHVRRERLAARQ